MRLLTATEAKAVERAERLYNMFINDKVRSCMAKHDKTEHLGM